MAIAAHQDDIEFMAFHGILECFRRDDKNFAAVVVTDGAGSPRKGFYKDYTDEQMKEVRKKEQEAAAVVGEYASLTQLGYPSAVVKDKNNTAVINDLYRLLMDMKPEFVYLHNLADKHDTHVAVALRSIAALRRMPKPLRPKHVYGCEVWRGLDWMDDYTVKLDVSGKINLAYALSNVYDSQISGGKNYGAAVTGRRLANATFAFSHATDNTTHLTYAMDLTPLIVDDTIDIAGFMLEHITRFNKSILEKLKL